MEQHSKECKAPQQEETVNNNEATDSQPQDTELAIIVEEVQEPIDLELTESDVELIEEVPLDQRPQKRRKRDHCTCEKTQCGSRCGCVDGCNEKCSCNQVTPSYCKNQRTSQS